MNFELESESLKKPGFLDMRNKSIGGRGKACANALWQEVLRVLRKRKRSHGPCADEWQEVSIVIW